jgi:hypothetical protein
MMNALAGLTVDLMKLNRTRRVGRRKDLHRYRHQRNLY